MKSWDFQSQKYMAYLNDKNKLVTRRQPQRINSYRTALPGWKRPHGCQVIAKNVRKGAILRRISARKQAPTEVWAEVNTANLYASSFLKVASFGVSPYKIPLPTSLGHSVDQLGGNIGLIKPFLCYPSRIRPLWQPNWDHPFFISLFWPHHP